jgi:hypothetical protein
LTAITPETTRPHCAWEACPPRLAHRLPRPIQREPTNPFACCRFGGTCDLRHSHFPHRSSRTSELLREPAQVRTYLASMVGTVSLARKIDPRALSTQSRFFSRHSFRSMRLSSGQYGGRRCSRSLCPNSAGHSLVCHLPAAVDEEVVQHQGAAGCVHRQRGDSLALDTHDPIRHRIHRAG